MPATNLSTLRGDLKHNDDFITISVSNSDNEEEEYKVQRALLTCASPWFTTALGKHFQEGQTRTLRFPGTEARVVRALVFWIFHRTLVGLDSEKDEQVFAAHLWIFGEEHLLPKLQNEAMRMLHKSLIFRSIFTTQPGDSLKMDVKSIGAVYQASQQGSKLRQRLTRAVVDWLDEGFLDKSTQLKVIHDVKALCGDVVGFYDDYGRELFRRRYDAAKVHGPCVDCLEQEIRDVQPYLLDETSAEQ